MLAVTILLAVLIGGLNAANFFITDRMTDRFLENLSENGGRNPGFQPVSPGKMHEMPGDIFGMRTEGQRPDFIEYFCIGWDGSGEVIFCDVRHMPSVTEAEAQQIAAEILEKGEKEGKDGGLRYKISEAPYGSGGGVTAVVADTSGQLRSAFRVLFLSLGAGAAGWLFMFLLVLHLSERAIRPIAENIEKQKRFVTDAGHEIKTPLAIIMANTDALELHGGETKWSRNIRTQTERLSGLMQDLLTLSKMDEGVSSLNLSEFSLSDLLVQTVQPFHEPAESADITVETEILPNIWMKGDLQQTGRLISVLMDNAVKYTEGGGKIQIQLKKLNGTAVLKFFNSCRSADGHPERWFDRFYREDSARTQKNGGSGIGLSVARAVAESHGGTIRAEYEGEREVAITVELPCVNQERP